MGIILKMFLGAFALAQFISLFAPFQLLVGAFPHQEVGGDSCCFFKFQIPYLRFAEVQWLKKN